jgi:hypothetical protein
VLKPQLLPVFVAAILISTDANVAIGADFSKTVSAEPESIGS